MLKWLNVLLHNHSGKKQMKQALVILTLSFVTIVNANAANILKLDLGSSTTDIEFDGTTLSTIDDGTATAGEQDTDINFTDFLGSLADITTDTASFTLDGVTTDGSVMLIGGLVVQPTIGGAFSLWDDTNSLLLSGIIDDGSIVGAVGGSATGSFANLSVGTFTGGSLAPLLDPESLGLSLSFTDINGGSGFATTGPLLDAFTATATANISAEEAAVPEPASISLALLGFLALFGISRRKR